MTNGRNRNRVFLSMLILDSITLVLKLGFTLWWLTAITEAKERFNLRPIHSDSDVMYEFVLFFSYCGCGGLIVWILLKWAANNHQYRKENLKNISDCCCCESCCWFFLGIVHLIHTGIFIFVDWCGLTDGPYPTCQWPRHLMIGFLFWETFMFGVMIIHKINKVDRSNRSESEP